MPALEKAGDAYVKALLALEPLLKQAQTYYGQGDHKDDDCARGRELHPKLMAAWDAYAKADKALHEISIRLNDERQERQLARLKKAGQTLPFLTRAMLHQAKVLVREGSVRDYPQLKLAPFKQKLKTFATSVSELDAYVTSHKQEADKVWWLDRVVSSSRDYLLTAKEMMRRKRDNKRYSTGERMTIRANNPQAVTGHPARFVQAYNRLIDDSNRMRM
jgi:hypothetical protein